MSFIPLTHTFLNQSMYSYNVKHSDIKLILFLLFDILPVHTSTLIYTHNVFAFIN